ncbi:MAG: hypothetical protein Q7K35_02575 [bacterium]|nr:hypothetical protein [bacterium]
MTTVINNPSGGGSENSSSLGIIFGVIIAIVLIGLFFFYGLPALRRAGTGSATNPSQPSGPTINIPDKIDINVNK